MAQRGFGDMARNGAYDAGVFATARPFFAAPGHHVCAGRNVSPLPPRVLAAGSDQKRATLDEVC
eukprot:5040109-Alexandrium_andersonii.AAC.1